MAFGLLESRLTALEYSFGLVNSLWQPRRLIPNGFAHRIALRARRASEWFDLPPGSLSRLTSSTRKRVVLSFESRLIGFYVLITTRSRFEFVLTEFHSVWVPYRCKSQGSEPGFGSLAISFAEVSKVTTPATNARCARLRWQVNGFCNSVLILQTRIQF